MKKKTLLPTVLLTLTTGLASAQAGYEPFELVREKDQVCKLSYEPKARHCYDIPEGTPKKVNIIKFAETKLKLAGDRTRDTFTIEDYEAFGPVALSDNNVLEDVLEQFSVLEVRNMAIDKDATIQTLDKISAPFVASLRWVGAYGMNGTIHVEGYIDVTDLEAKDLFADSIDSFSDSWTEAKAPSLRTLETAARAIHFISVYGVGANSDALTEELLTEVLAPAVGYEVLLKQQIEIGKGMAKVFAVGLLEALKEAFGSGLSEAQNQPASNDRALP